MVFESIRGRVELTFDRPHALKRSNAAFISQVAATECAIWLPEESGYKVWVEVIVADVD